MDKFSIIIVVISWISSNYQVLSCTQPVFGASSSVACHSNDINDDNSNTLSTVRSARRFDIYKLFPSAATQTKDFKFGLKLDPKTFSGLQTFISVNKFKTPLWWGNSGGSTALGTSNTINGPYHNPIDLLQPPSLSGTTTTTTSTSTVAAAAGQIVNDFHVNGTIATDPGNVHDDPIEPLIGYNKVPPQTGTIHQHASNFQLDFGLFHLSKNHYKLVTHQHPYYNAI